MSEPAGGPVKSRRDWVGWLERRVNLTEIFSFLSHFGFVYTPVDNRRPLRQVLREIGATRVPTYARWPRVLGILAAILFALETATGVLLAYYYRPTPEAAFESTQTIVRDLPSGWFIHQMHAWGAYLLVAIVLARLLRLYWDGLYRAPREVLWWSAVAMAWVIMQLDFTGHLLTWDSQSYWAIVRGMEVVWALPVVGPVLAFLLGGRVVNADVLIRFYVLHLLVLPACFTACIYLTFATLRRIGLSPSPEPAGRGITTFRQHLLDMSIMAVLLFAVLVTLATLLPFRFLEPADPYVTPGGVRPPWYMLAPYTVLQGTPLPKWIGGLGLLVVAFVILLLPLGLRGDGTPASRRRLRIAGVALVVVWLVLTLLGMQLDRR